MSKSGGQANAELGCSLLPLDTERISFRPWRPEDLADFHAINSDSQVMHYVGDGVPWTEQRSSEFIEASLAMAERCGYCQWPLIYKSDNCFIGFCGFVEGQPPEIGWRISPGYWGKGLATEAAKAVLNHALEVLHIRQMKATVQTANVASVRVIQKLGMSVQQSFDRDGREVAVYSRQFR